MLIDNCSIGTSTTSWLAGVGIYGDYSNSPANVTVNNCTIYATRRVITTFYISKNVYSGNNLFVASPALSQAFYCGIYVTGGDTPDTTLIYGNKVTQLLTNRTTTGFAAPVIMYGYAGVVNIVNNMFAPNFGNIATGTDPNNYYGLALGGFWAGTCNMYYNTIRLNATTNTGFISGIGFDGGWTEATTPTLTIKNNIFVIEKNDTTAYALNHRTKLVPLVSDFNNIKVGANAFSGNYQGAKCKTLADWQLASFQDINSKAVAVNFVSATDLRLIGTSVGDANLKGTPIPGWTKDINGNTRNATKPYMGADESQGQPSAVLVDGAVPTQFELNQNYPNPFNPSTQIRFTIAQPGATTLKIYDMMGREVSTLVNETLVTGTYSVKFDARGLSSGTYIYVLTSGGHRLANKMLLLK